MVVVVTVAVVVIVVVAIIQSNVKKQEGSGKNETVLNKNEVACHRCGIKGL